MKVQLFVPPKGYIAQRWEEGTTMPPLGILYLAAVLENEGVDVDVVPADVLDYGWEDIEKRIRDFLPDIVGITTTTENRFDSFKLAAAAKKIDPMILTVLGGPHISMAKEDTLIHVKEVDIAVIGEAEATLVELVRTLEKDRDFNRIKGLIFRRNENIMFTGHRGWIDNLDSLPFPARHLIPMEKYNFFVRTPDGKSRKAQNIITSRGCPFNCYFCATPVNWGRRVRGHSPERVINEIEHLIDVYGAEFIWFYDDTFNYNPRRVHTIMDRIIERELNIKFCNEFRIDLVDKPLLEKMVKAGLVWGHFGIEAGSARIRREVVKKEFDTEKGFQFVRWAKELGFVPNAFLIFSHYSEEIEDARETVKIMEKLKEINPETEFSTALLHVYPGTELEKIAKARGIVPEDFSWSRKSDMRKVHMLPAAQGYVPLFKDKLSWFQIADLVLRWSAGRKKVLSGSKFKAVLKGINSVRDIYVNFVFFLTMLKFKIRSFFSDKKEKNGRHKKPDMRVGH